jgi:hypothetical protein
VLWVVLVLVLALGALAVLVGYAVWLAHKTSDLLSEVAVLGDQAARLGDLLAQVGAPETAPRPAGPNGPTHEVRDVR